MKSASLIAGAAMVGAVLFAGPVWAQGVPQVVSIEKVDVVKVAAGYRATKIIASPVVNDANEKIGDVDDLLVEPSDKVLFAVLSVGGFLGIGERNVAVNFDQLKWVNEPVRTSANTPPAATTNTMPAAGSTSTVGSATTTTTTRSSTTPDHAVLSATKDQLKAMPQFTYAK